MKKKTEINPMIVISLDAVGTEDLPYLKTLPNFSRFWRDAAVCEQVRSVYPSLTYPAHTSIITGKYPLRPRDREQSADSAGAGEAGLVLAEKIYSGRNPL